MTAYSEQPVPIAFEDVNGHLNVRHYTGIASEGLDESLRRPRHPAAVAARRGMGVLLSRAPPDLPGRAAHRRQHVGAGPPARAAPSEPAHALVYLLDESHQQLSFVMEEIFLHIDMARPGARAPWPEDIAAKLDERIARDAELDWERRDVRLPQPALTIPGPPLPDRSRSAAPDAAVDAPPHDPRLQHAVDRPRAGTRKARPVGAKTCKPSGWTPSTEPQRRCGGRYVAQRAARRGAARTLRARSLSARLRAEVRSGSVAATSPTAKTPGLPGHAAGRGRRGRSRRRRAARRAASRCWAHPADRPQHRVGRRPAAGRCSTATGSLVIASQAKPSGTHGPVAGVQRRRRARRAGGGPAPRPAGGAGGAARSPGKYRSTRLSGQVARDVGRAAHRGRAAADDDDRRAAASRSCAARRSASTSSSDCSVGPPPEAVGHAGRDHQHVVRLASLARRRRRRPAPCAPSRSRPVSVPCTVRTRSRPRNRSKPIQ